MDMPWDVIASTIGGAGACAALARAYIARAVTDLEKVTHELQAVQKELVKVTVKLEHLEEVADTVSKHDRKIAALEQAILYAETNSKQPRVFPNGR